MRVDFVNESYPGEVRIGYNPEFARRVHAKRKAEAEFLASQQKSAPASKAGKVPCPDILEQKKQIRELIAKGRAAAAAYNARMTEDDEASLRGHYRHTYRAIEARICRATGVSRALICSKMRTQRIVEARNAIMYWSARLTVFSYLEIGRLMDKDHTTVMTACKRHPERRAAQGRYLRPARQ